MNYERIGGDGKSYFYYSLGQIFTWTLTDGNHSLKIESCTLSESGTQYYEYSYDGIYSKKAVSAARLHYILNEKKANCIAPGQSVLLKSIPQTYQLTLGEDEKQLIEQYRNLNPACKKLIRDNIKMLTISTTRK